VLTEGMRIIRIDEIPEEDRGEYSIKRLFTETLKHDVENVGFYRTLIPAGNKVPRHHHESLDEVLFFLTDGVVETEEYGQIEFQSGDSLFIEKGEDHEIIAVENEIRLIAVKLPNNVDDKRVTA